LQTSKTQNVALQVGQGDFPPNHNSGACCSFPWVAQSDVYSRFNLTQLLGYFEVKSLTPLTPSQQYLTVLIYYI
jgi:hypothetical protein